MPNRQDPKKSNRGAPVERRQQPRGDADSLDWETIALKRVERHVELLSGNPNSPLNAPNEFGWEDTAFRALQRRMRDLKAE
jgi:hypothetical protein